MTCVREIKTLTIVFQVNKHLLIACYEHGLVLSARDAPNEKHASAASSHALLTSRHFTTSYDINQTIKC